MIKLMITLNDLDDRICVKYTDFLKNEFDITAEIEKRGNIRFNLNWLIVNCPKAQTQDIFDYFLSLKPSSFNLQWIVVDWKKAQTQQFFDAYLATKPDCEDLSYIIINCPKAQNKQFFDTISIHLVPNMAT